MLENALWFGAGWLVGKYGWPVVKGWLVTIWKKVTT